MIYDTIIVGAGPAGATAAKALTNSGQKILILDKASFPRDKLCAGGVTAKVVPLLPRGFHNYYKAAITKGSLHYYRPESFISMQTEEPCVYMVERKDFDSYLLDAAIASGALLREGTKVTALCQYANHVEIQTNSCDILKARYIVAADGANSTIRSLTSQKKQLCSAFCLEAKVPWQPQHDEIILNFGNIQSGYAWIFPKGDYASIGVAIYRNMLPSIMTYYTQFLNRYGIKWEKPKGYNLPMYSLDSTLTNKRIFFTGDAARLVDPITGEGIYHAILSGTLAAQALISNNPSRTYRSMMKKTVLSELKKAYLMAKIIYKLPDHFFKTLKQNTELAEAYLDITSGKKNYANLLWMGLKYPVKNPLEAIRILLSTLEY